MREWTLIFIVAAVFLWYCHPMITSIESFLKALFDVFMEQWRLRKRFLRWKIKTIPDIKPEAQGPYR